MLVDQASTALAAAPAFKGARPDSVTHRGTPALGHASHSTQKANPQANTYFELDEFVIYYFMKLYALPDIVNVHLSCLMASVLKVCTTAVCPQLSACLNCLTASTV